MAQIIDGKAIAADVRREVAADVAALSSAHGLVPGLAVVIVGSRKDSQTYVNMKRKACAEVGICSIDVDLPEDISETALVAEVHRLNADPAVHVSAGLQACGPVDLGSLSSFHFLSISTKRRY
uniref:Tetrahydrofolate dehydrogenase/cyclohydrolase catalytic domain-containing protein n=1 Tax=Zea mays TaxID=4577 RepID=A0A804UH10_MAIZE